MGWMVWGSNSSEAKRFSFPTLVYIGSEAHPSSGTTGTMAMS